MLSREDAAGNTICAGWRFITYVKIHAELEAALGTVKSAARAIAVLEHFAAARRPLALKHIAAALGYPQSSASVLLKTLTTLGYLNYNRRRRIYFPTLRVAALGDWVAGALLGHDNLGETVRFVRDATGEQSAIAVQNDIYVQFIRLLPPADNARFHIDEGAMILLTRSAVGWTLLAALKDRQIDTIARRARIAADKAAAAPAVADVMAAVAKVRRDGFGYVENLPFAGVAALCVPLPIQIQDQAAVLGIGGPIARMRANRARNLAILKKAMAAIAAARTAPR